MAARHAPNPPAFTANSQPQQSLLSYTPNPIRIEGVNLPAELESLTEQLAEHTHDLWASHRLAEGWTHGPQRDDQARTHPCLIPYDQLPETEKDYDRQTAVGVLKAILALGCRIAPARPTGEPPSSGQ